LIARYRITLLLLALTLSCPLAYGVDQSLSLRMGGTVDRNLGNSGDGSFKGISAGLALGLVYDFFPLPMISLSPELHMHFFKQAHTPSKSPWATDYQQVHWHEVAVGIQAKLNLGGILYAGVGTGIHFSLKPHTTSHALTIASSFAPYFVIELGRTVYLLSQYKLESPAETLVGLHFALRFSGNFAAWNHLPSNGHFQSNYSLGLFVGATISRIAWPLI
jgi:hypothetical protein